MERTPPLDGNGHFLHGTFQFLGLERLAYSLFHSLVQRIVATEDTEASVMGSVTLFRGNVVMV